MQRLTPEELAWKDEARRQRRREDRYRSFIEITAWAVALAWLTYEIVREWRIWH